MEKINNIPVTFILSTGRTGTQFFSRYLTQTCPDVLCLHEPKPTRRFKWYSNFYLSRKLSGSFIANQYLTTRKRVFKNLEGKSYVESSNMIFGCIEPVSSVVEPVQVIHLVRHPLEYIKSHLNKGFWNGIKGFTARNIPGWLEFMGKDIAKSKDPVLILAARWVYVNQVIGQYENKFPYMSVLFEDLFANTDAAQASEVLNKIRAFVGCKEQSHEFNQKWLGQPANQSKTSISENWRIENKHAEYLLNNGSDLLHKYQYQISLDE